MEEQYSDDDVIPTASLVVSAVFRTCGFGPVVVLTKAKQEISYFDRESSVVVVKNTIRRLFERLRPCRHSRTRKEKRDDRSA